MNDIVRTSVRSQNTHPSLLRRSLPPIASMLGIAGLTLAAIAATAAAAQADTASGSTTANVDVGSTIALTNLTPSFTLAGNPGDTRSAMVTMTVTTNNFAGYTVTVQAASANFAPTIAGSSASIPISDLDVRETTVGSFVPLSAATPLQVHTQSAASASDGDTVSNDYQMTIPFVRADRYTATLNYIATTL